MQNDHMAEVQLEGMTFKETPDGEIEGQIKADILKAIMTYVVNPRGFIDFRLKKLPNPTKTGVTHIPQVIDSKERFKVETDK